jgi:HlyD family secretion protein
MASVPSHVVPVVSRPVNAGPVPVPARPARPRWLRWGIIVIVALALIAGGVVWRTSLQQSITYETVPVERGDVQAKVTATGNLNAVVDVLVSSQVSGNIKELYADWNSRVRKGQLVALIDPEVFQAQVDQATATSQSAHSSTLTAQAQVAKARADSSAASASVGNAQAIAAKDHANEVNTKGQWDRAERLFTEKILSRQDYDSARANYDVAQAQSIADQALVRAAQESIRSAQASVRVARGQLQAAQAQERQAEAALRQAQINLDRTRITAPVDGTVVARRMDVGQTVASTLNPPIIFEIAQDLTKMQVDSNVDESDIGRIGLCQTATFIVDSYPGTTFKGVVAEIRKAPIITQNVITYDVVISVDNSDLRLFPGMTANVTIATAKQENTLIVPNSALRFRPSAPVLKKYGLAQTQPDKPQLYVLRGGQLKAVPVKFGLSDGRYTAVASAEIQPGEQVVVRATTKEDTSNGSQAPVRPMGARM